MFPFAIWKDQAGKFQMLAATFLNNASWAQSTGRYETTDKTLQKWRLVDADFAQGHGEHSGAWFLPVPGSGLTPGQTGRYLLNVGGGNEFVVGDYDGHTNAFTNLSSVISTDFGLFSGDWAAVGVAPNDRVLQVGWLSDYRLNSKNHAPKTLPALSLIREIFYDRAANTLRAVPPAELNLLRNGSLGDAEAILSPGGAPTLVVAAGGGGSTADIEATFALRGDGAATIGLAVFCPPLVATNEALSACTTVTLDVSAVSGGTRSATMSVTVPMTSYVNATNATNPVFALPSARQVRLRAMTDRNIVEAFGADGLASVSILTFPSFADTAAFAFAHSGSVSVNVSAYSMGCQWLDEQSNGSFRVRAVSGSFKRLKHDDEQHIASGVTLSGDGFFLRNGSFFYPIGVNYWPGSTGCNLWTAKTFPAEEIQHDLDVLAASPFNSLRIFIEWGALEPTAGSFDEGKFEDLRKMLGWIKQRGLLVDVSTFMGWMSGRHYWPSWKNGRNLYTDATMINRSVAFAAKVAKTAAPFRSHLLAMEYGNEMNCCTDPAPTEATIAWTQKIYDAFKENAGSSVLVVPGTDEGTILGNTSWPLGACLHLC